MTKEEVIFAIFLSGSSKQICNHSSFCYMFGMKIWGAGMGLSTIAFEGLYKVLSYI